jgi:hypothetical protein
MRLHQRAHRDVGSRLLPILTKRRRNARCAFVVGGMLNGNERAVQFEGIADEPTGVTLGA